MLFDEAAEEILYKNSSYLNAFSQLLMHMPRDPWALLNGQGESWYALKEGTHLEERER